jgi:hypothetical protein
MYERWTLDCVIEVAQAIAKDFVSRPHQYRLVSEETAVILQDFWYLSGTDPNYPALHQRELIFSPMLGPSDGRPGDRTSEFHMDSGALRQKADDFTNRVFSTGEENLRKAFYDEAITFRAYLETLEENIVVKTGDRQTRSIFEKAVKVLIDPKVTGVFGRPPANVENWPLAKPSGEPTIDKDGALFIEEVTMAIETSRGEVPQSQFIVMQRIGAFGKRTIEGVLDTDLTPDIPVEEIEPLIQTTYSWKTALDALAM